LKKLKYKKRFVYLISPNKIENKFYSDLKDVLKSGKVKYFQLRLKKYREKKIVNIGKKIKKICKKFSVKLIINDDPIIAKKINADGCHVGQSDMDIYRSRKILNKKIIGITCHNSIKLVREALNNNADYIALGSFFPTKTKKVTFKANIKTLRDAKKITNIPIVVVGGIKSSNYKKLLLNKANFLAISSFIWKNKKLKPIEAIKEIV